MLGSREPRAASREPRAGEEGPIATTGDETPLTLEAVRDARARIADGVVRTPLLRVAPRPGLEILAKPEALQPTGSFKLRGALAAIRRLPAPVRGVVAHSSGNHAQAVARAAALQGLRAVVVMPSDAPARKRARTEADGARVVTVGPDSAERARRAAGIAEDEGLALVEPYDDPAVMAGQGTAALELVEEAGGFERFYAPVSGGGLLAGCATVLRALAPGTEIVAVEPEDADRLARSLRAGERRSVAPPRTIADALRVRTPGARAWPVLARCVHRAVGVSDDAMLDAMAFALRELRVVLEPAGAAALAAALREGEGRCAVLCSGGNAAPEALAEAARRAGAAGADVLRSQARGSRGGG